MATYVPADGLTPRHGFRGRIALFRGLRRDPLSYIGPTLTVNWRVEEMSRDGHIRFVKVADMREDRPREHVLQFVSVRIVCDLTPRTSDTLPWSCSGSGAVAARRRDNRKYWPSAEAPYLDSLRIATP